MKQLTYKIKRNCQLFEEIEKKEEFVRDNLHWFGGYNWHITQSCIVFMMSQANIEFSLHIGLIETWEAKSCISCYKITFYDKKKINYYLIVIQSDEKKNCSNLRIA